MCNLKGVNCGVNRTILQINLLLLLIVFFFRKCIRLIVKITEQNKCLFLIFMEDSKTKPTWKIYSREFKTRIHDLSRSSPLQLPQPPPPPPICFNVGILSALNRRPIQNSYETFACHISIEKRPTLIRGKGICLHIYHILRLQNRISVLNV